MSTTDADSVASERAEDGKSFLNPATEKLSPAYDAFVDPLAKDRRGGFDVHVYFLHTDPDQTKFAKELWERVRRECKHGLHLPPRLHQEQRLVYVRNVALTSAVPELRIYKVWEQPLGPHPIGMFEVNVFTPAQFGAFVPWLVIHRGPLSVLVHPNTDDEVRDHTQRATWMGDRYPLNLHLFKEVREMRDRRATEAAAKVPSTEK